MLQQLASPKISFIYTSFVASFFSQKMIEKCDFPKIAIKIENTISSLLLSVKKGIQNLFNTLQTP